MHCISGVAYSVGTKATRRKAAVYILRCTRPYNAEI